MRETWIILNVEKGRTKTAETEMCKVSDREDTHLKEVGEGPEPGNDSLASDPLNH